MTLKEFRHYADLHGGDLDRWPPPLCFEAMVLLDRSDEARAILAEAAALDALLDHASVTVGQDRVARVAAAVAARLDATARDALSRWALSAPPVTLWPAASLLAVMAVAGFLITSAGLLPLEAAVAWVGPAGHLPDVLTVGYNPGVLQ